MTPNKRVIRVAIVGGGISGIAQAVRLQEALGSNVEFTIYERGAEPGGVWRDSTWPGAGVDIPIHLYQLYSHLNSQFSEKYARRDEVLAYWNAIIDKHKIRSRFVFSANFTSSTWDTVSQQHYLTFLTPSGDTIESTCNVLISAAGALNKPIIPALPGIETFQGDQWHSSRWNPNQVDLRGKRIAVVGNGSSGIQVVPNIVDLEGIQITQFMRSPGYFKPKANFQYSSWTKFAFKWVPLANRLYRWWIFYQYDLLGMSKGTGKWSSAMREDVTIKLVNYLKGKAPAEYHDILIPKYPLHCKRVAYNAGWLESLNLPNVTLSATPITAVHPRGLLTSDGVVHDFDIIVWATGFDVSGTGVGLNHGVKGEEGRDLSEIWEEIKGAQAFLAVAVAKFPNYFIVLGPNAISMSWGYTLGNQTEFIARLVKGIYDHRLTSIAPKPEVAELYNQTLQNRLEQTVLTSKLCTAWYRYRGTGRVIAPSGISATELTLRTRKINWEDWQTLGPYGAHKAIEIRVQPERTWNPLSTAVDRLASWFESYLLKITTI